MNISGGATSSARVEVSEAIGWSGYLLACEQTKIDRAVFDAIARSSVTHHRGHRIAPAGRGRFSPEGRL